MCRNNFSLISFILIIPALLFMTGSFSGSFMLCPALLAIAGIADICLFLLCESALECFRPLIYMINVNYIAPASKINNINTL
jgi:hypothetical protein